MSSRHFTLNGNPPLYAIKYGRKKKTDKKPKINLLIYLYFAVDKNQQTVKQVAKGIFSHFIVRNFHGFFFIA